jgi:cyclohexa-1,5-dienecarbonyl-CoA hydratase
MDGGFRFLSVRNDGAVGRIVLRRPPLNVMHVEMIEELNRALRDLRYEPGLRALVLAAQGKCFSAGVAVEDHLPEKVQPMLGAFHDTFRQLRRLACPTIAAVQGPALGGGCELACFADWVIASENATFGQPEIKLGVFPPVAAIHFPHRIGLARTMQLLLSGEILTAHEAERIGLVDRVVAPEKIEEAVEIVVASLREKSGPALRLAKRAALAAEGLGFEEGLREVERIFLEDLMRTRDAGEGLRAFLEKRAPAWRHN